MDEVDSDSLIRQFKIWVPYGFMLDSNDLTIEVISNKAGSTMLFKPESRIVKVDKKELDKNVGINFKVT